MVKSCVGVGRGREVGVGKMMQRVVAGCVNWTSWRERAQACEGLVSYSVTVSSTRRFDVSRESGRRESSVD